MDTKIVVEREPFEKNGKVYQNYFIRGNVRGIDIRVLVVPPDFGGYTVLDIGYRVCGCKGGRARARSL